MSFNEKFIILQLGVNGYSFLIDNNGRVLYHPDLRPLVRFENYEIIELIVRYFR